MLQDFENYLVKQGYSVSTPSGKPSTVYDYIKRVETICEREDISINSLSNNIDDFVEKYGPSGNESEFGKKSHNAYISALKKFKDFLG